MLDVLNTKINETLQVHPFEDKIFMPNEIFHDLTKVIHKSSHIAFAYTYYFLSLWLYRYAKYSSINLDTKLIKRVLGMYENNKTMNYIIKKEGVLDQLQYTYTSTDFPISWYLEEGYLTFDMFSELDIDNRKIILQQRGKNYKIKVPIKGIHRTEESMNDNYEDGVFYEIDNTHQVDWELFIRCMSDDKFGCITFYIYNFLKYKCDMYQEGYTSSIMKLSHDSGLNAKTLCRYLDTLKKYNWISCDAQDYIIGIDKDERKANTYYVNIIDEFTYSPISYAKGKVINLEDYEKSENERNMYRENVDEMWK